VFNLQGSEIIVILLLALVVLGPEKLPDAIRKFSQTYGEVKKMGNGFQNELKSALDEPMREMRETADLVQRSADPARLAEEAENEAHLRAEADAAALTGAADLPIDPAALAVSDPAAVAADISAAPVIGKAANGETVKKVNQIALSMARGPIDPKPAVVAAPTAPSAEVSVEAEDHSALLTAMPQGAAAMLAPPPSGTVVPDAPPPPPRVADDDAEMSAP
jgi:sec-independent protein translocase protein TatB